MRFRQTPRPPLVYPAIMQNRRVKECTCYRNVIKRSLSWLCPRSNPLLWLAEVFSTHLFHIHIDVTLGLNQNQPLSLSLQIIILLICSVTYVVSLLRNKFFTIRLSVYPYSDKQFNPQVTICWSSSSPLFHPYFCSHSNEFNWAKYRYMYYLGYILRS